MLCRTESILNWDVSVVSGVALKIPLRYDSNVCAVNVAAGAAYDEAELIVK